jgi:hypothetical protein
MPLLKSLLYGGDFFVQVFFVASFLDGCSQKRFGIYAITIFICAFYRVFE